MDIALTQSGMNAADFEKARFSAATNRLALARDSVLAGKAGDNQNVRKAAESFESVFLGQMLAPMFAGLGTDGPFGGGHAEEIYRSMLVDELGAGIAKNGGIGIADVIYDHLLKLQEI